MVATWATQDIKPYAFNRDLAAPMSVQDHAVYAVGLIPDIPCRRRTYRTYGHNEFDEGLALGWLSKQEADGARSEKHELVELVEGDDLLRVLDETQPFGPSSAPERPEMKRLPIAQAHAILRPEPARRGDCVPRRSLRRRVLQ